jgi:hypothetical protein
MNDILIGILIALFGVPLGNSAFAQPVETTGNTSNCLIYDGINLKIVDMNWHSPILKVAIDCAKELDVIIGSFRPTEIAVSTQELQIGEDQYREDLVYLTK